MDTALLLSSLRPDGGSSPDQAIEAVYATGHWLLAADRIADAAKVFRLMLRAVPSDERGWLALGECHERNLQPSIAAELYGAGSVAAPSSVRCLLARSRVLRSHGRHDDAERDMAEAERRADALMDEQLSALVALEKGAWS